MKPTWILWTCVVFLIILSNSEIFASAQELALDTQFVRTTSGILTKTVRDRYEASLSLLSLPHTMVIEQTGEFSGLFRRISEEEPIPEPSSRNMHFRSDILLPRESLPLADYVMVGEKTFELQVSHERRRVSVIPYSPFQDATITLSMQPELMLLHAKSTNKYWLLARPMNNINLPADTYELIWYVCHRDDDAGIAWTVEGRGGTPVIMEVKSDGVTDVHYGEPFRIAFPISERMMNAIRSGRTQLVSMEFAYQDHVGMEVRQPYFRQTGQRTRPQSLGLPSYRVETSAGDVIAAGKFEYG